MFNLLIYIAVLVFSLTVLEGKVLIITHSYMRPDFIELQHKTFKKFIKNEYEFVVFNDAKSKDLECSINQVCKKLGIRSYRVSPSIHNKPYLKREIGEDYNHPCVRCANVVQYSLDRIGFSHDDLVVIIDSDMFVIDFLDIKQIMENYDLAAVMQSRSYRENVVEYIWNGLVFFNMKTLPEKHTINFNSGNISGVGVDAGGYTYFYLKNHPSVRLKHIDCNHSSGFFLEDFFNKGSSPSLIEFLSKQPNNIELLLKDKILHYRGGGNWNNCSSEYHEQKSVLFNDFINKLLKEE